MAGSIAASSLCALPSAYAPRIEARPPSALPRHQASICAATVACASQRKTGRPKVHSVMKAWQGTGAKGSDNPSASVL